jgi:hypothetical protein
MKLHSILKLVLATSVIACYGAVARADDVQSWFVPVEQCNSRACVCKDLPTLKLFLDDQKRALAAWKSVKAATVAGTGPTTPAAARALFNSLLGSGSPGIITQYKSCPGYDPTKNDPKKIAGVNAAGVPVFDPCFCGAFCNDVIQATLAHEKMHFTSGVILTAGSLHMLAFCKVVNHPECAKVAPLTLAASEIASHDAGIAKLQEAIDKLLASSDEDCTTTPPKPPDGGTPTPAPTTLSSRVGLLFERIVGGATR